MNSLPRLVGKTPTAISPDPSQSSDFQNRSLLVLNSSGNEKQIESMSLSNPRFERVHTSSICGANDSIAISLNNSSITLDSDDEVNVNANSLNIGTYSQNCSTTINGNLTCTGDISCDDQSCVLINTRMLTATRNSQSGTETLLTVDADNMRVITGENSNIQLNGGVSIPALHQDKTGGLYFFWAVNEINAANDGKTVPRGSVIYRDTAYTSGGYSYGTGSNKVYFKIYEGDNSAAFSGTWSFYTLNTIILPRFSSGKTSSNSTMLFAVLWY